MIHYGGSDKMYLSEEMIGAYLEGNLAPHDARYVESLIERDSNLSSLVDECKTFNDFSHQYGYHDAISFTGAEDTFPDLDDSFSLPEIPAGTYNTVEIELTPFTFDIIDPFELQDEYMDACVCANTLEDVDTMSFGIDDLTSINGLGDSGLNNGEINNMDF